MLRRGTRLAAAGLRFLLRFETGALVLSILAASALWAFFSLAGEVAEGDTRTFDRQAILLLRNPADLSDPIGFTLVTVTTVVGVLAFVFHGRLRHALVLAGAVLLSWMSSETTKLLYGRERPDLVPHGAYVYSGSFPSGHSTMAAATFLTLAILIASLEPKRRTKALVYGLALLVLVTVGLSRVYLGVHWPSDVLAGWTLGAVWALLGWIVLRRIGGRTRG